MNAAFILAVINIHLISNLAAQNLELLLLHTNDMHGKFEEITPKGNTCNEVEKNKTCVGGFARLTHEIRKYRKWGEENSKNVLFLNAGDTFVGSDFYSVHKWKICSEFLKLLRPNVMTLGNHEFDDGIEVLREFTKSLDFPIVCANLNTSLIPPVQKSTILEIEGRKIGIIGYVTTETAQLSNIGDVNITEELNAVKYESERLDKEGVKIIIGLGHSGYDIDKKLAKEIPLLDIIIGGHSNTFLWNGPKPSVEDIQGPYPTVITQQNGKKVPVVQAYAYTLYLGRLNVTFDGNGELIDFNGQPEFLFSDIPQDQDVLDALERYRPAVDAVNREIVGQSSVYLDGMCRTQECNFGNLITDAMVYYAAFQNRLIDELWSNASVAIYNSGNLRNSINVTYTQGNITKGELLAALPFENKLLSVKLRGSVLQEALEHTVDNYANNFITAQFLQVSGLRVEYDLSKEKGHRVVSVKVRCSNCTIPKYEPLDPNSSYTVLMTDFIQNGGDGFDMIKQDSRDLKDYDISIFDLLIWYLKIQSPVYPELQGRIKFISPNSSGIVKSSIGLTVFSICLLLFGIGRRY